jgi:hypothetical protein
VQHDCDWSGTPDRDVPWPIDRLPGVPARLVADVYAQPRRFVALDPNTVPTAVEQGTDGSGKRRCRTVREGMVTAYLADVFCAQVFHPVRWRRLKPLGTGAIIVSAVALSVAFGGLGLHLLAQPLADLVGLGGTAAGAVGAVVNGASPRPRAKRKGQPGMPFTYVRYVSPQISRRQPLLEQGEWRPCKVSDRTGTHEVCGRA